MPSRAQRRFERCAECGRRLGALDVRYATPEHHTLVVCGQRCLTGAMARERRKYARVYGPGEIRIVR
jgi:hypothetical protein